MKRKEILELNPSEYSSKLTELKKELVKLNAQAAIGTAMKNPGKLKQTKKNIARIFTMMNDKRKGVNKKA